MHTEATFEQYLKEIDMTQTEPQFKPGDRVFSHYVMGWGTVEKATDTRRGDTHGVSGEPMPDTTWYRVKMDKGNIEHFDDCHGDWDNARMVPPHIAKRFDYGDDPNPTGGIAIRLEYLRGELRGERISQGELVELQGLAEHIDKGDVELLEAAGVPEFEEQMPPEPEVLDAGDLDEVEQGRRERQEFYRNRDYGDFGPRF